MLTIEKEWMQLVGVDRFDLIFDHQVSVRPVFRITVWISVKLSCLPKTPQKGMNAILTAAQFFCMIPPSTRPKWAQKMSGLLARPCGRLVCHEFPTGKHVSRGGPPFFAALWCYDLHLTYPGNEKVIDYENQVLDVDQGPIPSGCLGLTMLARSMVEDSNTTRMLRGGENGRDWVSVWAPTLGGVKRKASLFKGSKVDLLDQTG